MLITTSQQVPKLGCSWQTTPIESDLALDITQLAGNKILQAKSAV